MSLFYKNFEEITGQTRDLINDNTSREISEQDVRERFYEIAYSCFNYLSGFNIKQYNSGTAYLVGDLVYDSQKLYRKIGNGGTFPLTNTAQWEQLSSNPFSSQTKFGLVELATNSEAIAGSNATKVITPSTLREALLAAVLSGITTQDLFLEDIIDVSGATSGETLNNQVLIYDEVNEVFTTNYVLNTSGDTFLNYDTTTRELNLITDLFGVTGLTLETFTGSTITDNLNIKQALQVIETFIENRILMMNPNSIVYTDINGEQKSDPTNIGFDEATGIMNIGNLLNFYVDGKFTQFISPQPTAIADSSIQYVEDFNGAGTASPSFITEDNKRIQLREAEIKSFDIKFGINLETIYVISGLVGNQYEFLSLDFGIRLTSVDIQVRDVTAGDENTVWVDIADITTLNTFVNGLGVASDWDIRLISVINEPDFTTGIASLKYRIK